MLVAAVSCSAAVEFPGPSPGNAKFEQTGDGFTLENAVIAESWQVANGQLRPLRLTDKLTGKAFDQSGAELFCLGLTPPRKQTGMAVAVRLETGRVVVLAASDDSNWTELAAFPRAEFSGEPKLVRLGKLDLLAQPKSYSDLGAPGKCVIADFNLANAVQSPAEFVLDAKANQAEVREFSFPAGTNFVSCRIDKGTDQGMSWAPALALVWEDGKNSCWSASAMPGGYSTSHDGGG